jgi:spermidine synthase
MLYSVNTFGAVVGALLTGFVLIGAYGVLATMRLAAVGNLLIGLVAILTAGFRPVPDVGTSTMPEPEPSRVGSADSRWSRNQIRIILFVAFMSGFASLAYEVVWTRMLIHFSGTTTYAFTTILVTFLLGIAVGSAIARWILRLEIDLWTTIAGIQLMIGGAALLSTVAINHLGSIDLLVSSLLSSPMTGVWQEGLILSLAKNAAVMFLPALLMGIFLPVAVGILENGAASAGRTVGGLFSVNTFGSILGSFTAGFLLIPLLGSGWSVSLLVLINTGLALLLFYVHEPRLRRVGFATSLLVVVLSSGFLSKDLFRSIYPRERLIYFAEGTAATVAVVADEDPLNPDYRRMFVDGNGLSGTDYSGRRYMKLLGHLPVLLSGESPRSALVICLGTGMTLGAVSLHPSIQRLDCVEISREVVEAAAYFSSDNGDVLQDDDVRIYIEDGRNFLRTTTHQYDLITLEPPPPRSAGVVNLYSREFYRDALNRLQEGGVVCQWIPLHDQSEEDVRSLIRTFLDVFPHVTAWLIERNEIALLGSTRPQEIDMGVVARLFDHPVVGEDLRSVDIADLYSLLSLFLMDERGLREYAGAGEPITDDRPAIEFFLFQGENRTFRHSPYVREGYLSALERMTKFRGDVRSLIDGGDGLDGGRLHDHRTAMRHFIDGTILRNRVQEEEARRAFLRAVRCIGDNGYFRHYLGISPIQKAEAEKRSEREPENLAARNRIGYIRFLEGDLEGARRAFGVVLDREPSNIDALINLGMVLETEGKITEAHTVFSKALKGRPGPLTGIIEERIRILEVAGEVRDGMDSERSHEVGLLLWRSGRYEEAAAWFERAVEAEPSLELAHFNLAATYEAIGRYPEALSHYETSYSLGGGPTAANNIEKLRLFLAIEREGREEVTLVNGERNVVSWDDPRALNRLGIRFFRNAEYARAAEVFLRATAWNPDYAEAFVNAGDALREIGEPERALSTYLRALEIDPSLEHTVRDRIWAIDGTG